MENIQDVFNSRADEYDKWYDGEFGKSAFELESKVLDQADPLSLEIGVGTGRFAEKLGINYGVDISKEVLKLAKEKDITVLTGKGEKLPFKDKTFESAYLIVTICFVEKPEKVIKEAKRVLKKDGTINLGLILEKSPWADYYKQKAKKGNKFYQNASFYKKGYIEKLLKNNSFKNLKYKSIIFQNPKTKKLEPEKPKKGYNPKAGFTGIKATKK